MTDQPDDIRGRALAEKIQDVEFTPGWLRKGHDMAEVDALLDELSAAASAGRVLAPLLASARLTCVRWREGYDNR